MSEVPKRVVCVRLAMSESLSRRHLPWAEGHWLHRGRRRAATNGPLSPVHALECDRGEGPLSIPASCPYPAACAASGDVSPKAATGGGVLPRGLALGLVALSALVFAVPSEAQTNTAPTGKPTIDGTPHAGEILTASVSGIADANGLTNPGYTYQWIRDRGLHRTARSPTGLKLRVDADAVLKRIVRACREERIQVDLTWHRCLPYGLQAVLDVNRSNVTRWTASNGAGTTR